MYSEKKGILEVTDHNQNRDSTTRVAMTPTVNVNKPYTTPCWLVLNIIYRPLILSSLTSLHSSLLLPVPLHHVLSHVRLNKTRYS